MSSSTVQVVTLAKNDASGLRMTRASVLGQDHVHLEHTIVTAPSSDSTEALAASIGRARNARHVRDAPSGIYPAMNWILQGLPPNDQVIFLNAGDIFLHSAAVSELVAAADNSPMRWSTSSFFVVGPRGWIRSHIQIDPTNQWQDVGHQATMAPVHRLLELGGFDTSYRIFADGKLLRNLRMMGPPGVVSGSSVAYFLGGYSTDHPLMMVRELHRLDAETGRPCKGLRASLNLIISALSVKALMFLSEFNLVPDSLFRLPRSERHRLEPDLNSAPHWPHLRTTFDSISCCFSVHSFVE